MSVASTAAAAAAACTAATAAAIQATAQAVDVVVIGAGVLGLAVSRALLAPSRRCRTVLLLEQHAHIGMETSSRNSEIIHAGLYYPRDSSKARLCVRGKQLLYDYCQARNIPFENCGKLIVATDQYQYQTVLPVLQEKAVQNGVTDTKLLRVQDVRVLEPAVSCVGGALWSPSTGLVDSHSLLYSLLADAEEMGSNSSVSATSENHDNPFTLALETKVEDARLLWNENNNPKVYLYAAGMWLSCNAVINCAGLWADRIATMIHCNPAATATTATAWKPPRQYFCKGTYFSLQSSSITHCPFHHLIYPVPDPRGGLGVHATFDLGLARASSTSSFTEPKMRRVKFGPDVEWLPIDQTVETIDYTPDPERANVFYNAIRKYWPDLPDHSLQPDYAGVRPKLTHPDLLQSQSQQLQQQDPSRGSSHSPVPFQDFAILGPETHGVPGLVHLMGMESPGLTASLAIAEHVADLVQKA